MRKIKFAKRILASALSAAMLLSCTAVSTLSPAVVTAADGHDYAEALELSLYFYDANQCGSNVDDNPLTWRGNCHTYDAEASLDNAQGLSSASKSAIMAQNGGSNKVDVSGGYHDAGDHIKFSMTMGFSTASLAWSYFTYPEAYKETGCEAHLMDILKESCDYLMKVTYLDDNNSVIAFCYQVAAEGEDHGTWTPPETQTMTRTTYWADASHPSADASGEMAAALASSSLAFKDKDPEYAAECLKYANALSEFTKKYPSATYDGVGSMYASGSQKDDIAWAELWCALANNGGTLPSSYTPTYQITQNGCYNGSEYDYHLYCWDKVWAGYAALLAEVGYKQDTYLNELKFELSNKGGLSTSKYNADGWGASRYNCGLQMVALHIADLTNDSSYAAGAKYQMDFILGDNPSGKSFLLGYGSQWPTKIHHKAANPGSFTANDNSDATYTPYGCLVGGPNSNGEYEDNKNSYSCTEPALDYNGAFALAIAGLYTRYGGDVNAADDLVKTVSEIDENHVFGSWYQSKPEPPVTEVTTEPVVTTVTTEATTETTTEITTEITTTVSETEPETTSVPSSETTETTIVIGTPTKYGDVNTDGRVTVSDVVSINMYLINQTENQLNEVQLANSDCARDGIIDTADSALIMNYVAMTVSIDELGK